MKKFTKILIYRGRYVFTDRCEEWFPSRSAAVMAPPPRRKPIAMNSISEQALRKLNVENTNTAKIKKLESANARLEAKIAAVEAELRSTEEKLALYKVPPVCCAENCRFHGKRSNEGTSRDSDSNDGDDEISRWYDDDDDDVMCDDDDDAEILCNDDDDSSDVDDDYIDFSGDKMDCDDDDDEDFSGDENECDKRSRQITDNKGVSNIVGCSKKNSDIVDCNKSVSDVVDCNTSNNIIHNYESSLSSSKRIRKPNRKYL